jgi:regulation of enolase protein 1 (concanavalin A-like superfamily)
VKNLVLNVRARAHGIKILEAAAMSRYVVTTLGAIVFSVVLSGPRAAVLAGTADAPFPWNAVDVGAVGQPGHTSQNSDGTFSIAGAGADIWGTADAFQFAYQSVDGDVDIWVRVQSQDATHPFAKAGIMIRQSLDPSSAHAILDVKPDGGIEFMTRSVTGGTTTYIGGANFGTPVWLKLSRRGDTVLAMAAQSVPGLPSYVVIGRASIFTGPAHVGMVVTSHDPSVLNTARLDQPDLKLLPVGWTRTDIGDVEVPGDATVFGDGTITVSGAGSDIWGAADSFHYFWSTLGGDGEVLTKVLSEQNTHFYAKAGVMLRGSLAANAPAVILDVLPNGQLEFMARPQAGADMAFLAGGAAAFPVWLKLARSGNVFTGSVSPDGFNWSVVGSTSFDAGPSMHAGLAVTSHDRTVLNQARFAELAITPATAPSNLLLKSSFEEYAPPALGLPGWVSDDYRQSPAQSDFNQPHSGAKNGLCYTNVNLDCGLYQDVTAPSTGTYTVTFHATANRPGGLIGANVNGRLAISTGVEARGFGQYGSPYTMRFEASANDIIEVWMYSPNTPGYVAIDDVSLTVQTVE